MVEGSTAARRVMRRVGKWVWRRVLVERPRTPAPMTVMGLSLEVGAVGVRVELSIVVKLAVEKRCVDGMLKLLNRVCRL